MATIKRVRVAWSGTAVQGGGVSTFYLDTPDAGWLSDITSFYTAIKSAFPASVSWTIPGTGDELDSVTGNITGTWTETGGNTVVGEGVAGAYAAGVGARAVWFTLGRTNNRAVRGSTYLVPLMSGGYASDGTITTTYLSTLDAAAQALWTNLGPSFVIWTRPKGPAAGTLNSVIGAGVPDKVSWLRSRRV